MPHSLQERLLQNIAVSLENDHQDNYDEERFGPNKEKRSVVKETIKKTFLKNRIHKTEVLALLRQSFNFSGKNSQDLNRLYDALADEESKDLLVDLITYRILGHKKVKLKVNNEQNNGMLRQLKELADKNDTIDPNFMHLRLNRFDLNKLGKDINIYLNPTGILVDFFIEQYRYRVAKKEIGVQKGDTVLDVGGCWADTALYFADLAGAEGKVYSFEFIPNNIKIFKQNCALNPKLQSVINLVDHPAWSHSGQKVFFKDEGPSSRVAFEDFKESNGQTTTLSVDDLVAQRAIGRVDFIKMDIEGAEMNALEGARKTIVKDKPVLAIAIYHSPEDFVQIPGWILDLDLGYKLYLGHNTIHAEETVIFAQVHD